MHLWKEIRLSRIINPVSKKTIIVPMDHHWTWIVPIKWIEDPAILSEKLVNGWADAILAHTWTLKHWFAKTCIWKWAGSILHMCVTSWLSPKPNRKMIVNTLKTAITMWVDAVSTQLNLWDENENEMIQDLALLANECNEWWIPLIAMVYVRWHDLKEVDLDNLKLSARIASELWCDMVKIPYIWNSKEMEEIVNSTQIPVVIAWGSKMSDIETLEMISGAMEAGCSWLSVWRNVFARKNPEEFLNIVKKIVHEWLNLEEAKKML
jgi:DhnA family fructose-bisphosphate aldolase class Ia